MVSNFGKRIKSLRIALKISQQKMAKDVGIHKQTLSKYERGEVDPGGEVLSKFANYYPINPAWLLTGEGEMYAADRKASSSNADKFVYVPFFNVEASAGSGAVIESEQIVESLPFKKDWVKNNLLTEPRNLVLISALGDSMTPTIQDGDLILLDTSKKELKKEEGVYCFSNDDHHLMIKRLQSLLEGGILVRSDNDQYENLTLSKSQAESLVIIGKVVWVGRKF